MAGPAPTLAVERSCWDAGHAMVCGIDEVGRGAWAGPVTVCALVVPRDRRLYKVRDSKLLTVDQRERLFDRIVDWSPAWAVGHSSHEECDRHGMTAALRMAGERALASLTAQGVEPDRILLDGKHDYLGAEQVETIVGGDGSSLAIAAASVVAKVTRDRLMRADAEHFPAYGFESNVGYPSPQHRAALSAYGPTVVHRRSWVFNEGLPWFRLGPEQRSLF